MGSAQEIVWSVIAALILVELYQISKTLKECLSALREISASVDSRSR